MLLNILFFKLRFIFPLLLKKIHIQKNCTNQATKKIITKGKKFTII